MSEHQPTQNEEVIEAIETPEEYIEKEVATLRKNLQLTQVCGSIAMFGVMCFLFSIANGFATNLEPKTAANITKGLVVQRLEEAQPQISDYLRNEIPGLIKQVPGLAQEQLPVVRENIEDSLEKEIEKLATDTSDQLDLALSTFLIEKQDEFKTIILAGQDKETTDEVAFALRTMFIAYLSESHNGEESIQEKLDKSLVALKEIENKTHRLAYNKELDGVELKTRRAIACLFGTVSENRDALALPTQAQAQNTVAGYLKLAEDIAPR